MLQSASAQSMAHPQKVEISMDGRQCVELSGKHIDRSPPRQGPIFGGSSATDVLALSLLLNPSTPRISRVSSAGRVFPLTTRPACYR